MSETAIVFAATVGISIIVAALLAIFAQSTSRPGDKPRLERRIERRLALDIPVDDYTKEIIYARVAEALGSEEHCREVCRVISNIFKKELAQKTEMSKEKMERLYGPIVKDSARTEENAWRKYRSVLYDKKETEAVVRSMAEGLVVADARGKILLMNPAAKRLFGISKDTRAEGTLLQRLAKTQLISMVKDIPAGEEKEIEVETYGQGEEMRKVVRSNNAVIEDRDGRTVGMVSILSDITKQRQLDRMKLDFVASVSHEFRAPIITSRKAVSLILNKESGHVLSDTQEHFLNMAERNLKKLDVMVGSLLGVFSYVSGKMELKRETAAIEEIIGESVDDLLAWANAKSINITKMLGHNIPRVNIDRVKTGQVLSNLLGNAIKYTPENGRITIAADYKAETNEVEVSVEDSGVGIAQEDLPKLFDRFYQTGERSLSDISGTGIGLSITKEIVEAHGGRIWAESQPGRGARFIFRLKTI